MNVDLSRDPVTQRINLLLLLNPSTFEEERFLMTLHDIFRQGGQVVLITDDVEVTYDWSRKDNS